MASACKRWHGRADHTGCRRRLAIESPDGKTVLYQSKKGDSPIVKMSLSGGPARQIVKCARPTALLWGPTVSITCMWLQRRCRRSRYGSGDRPRSGSLAHLQAMLSLYPMGLAASPDGRTILYNRFPNEVRPTMLIENFVDLTRSRARRIVAESPCRQGHTIILQNCG